MTTPFVCPLCSAPIEVDETGKVFEPTFIQAFATTSKRVGYLGRIAPIAFCTGCEFCIEIPRVPAVAHPRQTK